MTLTFEEQKALYDSAMELGKALTILYLAKDRLESMASLSANLLGYKLDTVMMSSAMKQYEEDYAKAEEAFLNLMGVEDADDPMRVFIKTRIQEQLQALKSQAQPTATS